MKASINIMGPKDTQYQNLQSSTSTDYLVRPTTPSMRNPGGDVTVSGIIFAFFLPPLGLLLSIIGLRRSKKAGLRNRLAIVGTIVSAFTTILAIGVLVFFVNMLMTASAKCEELGAGTHYVDVTTKIRCE